LDDYQDVALSSADWSGLDGRAEVEVFRDYLGSDPSKVIAALEPFDVVVCMRERTPFPAEVLSALPALQLLVTTGMANAAIDVAAANARGVTVCGTGGLLSPTSELAWGLIHSLTRKIPQEDRALREGRWQTTMGVELAGRTLGLLGLGGLGQRMARVARAFDMPIVAWSQNLTADVAAEHGATLVSKDELFARSDILSVHLKLSERTEGLVGARELALMKATAYLINTSRGPIVDTDALVAALHTGAIAGAGLDVFDVEPLPADHPLRSAPNTVLTPHIGYVGVDTYAIFFGQVVEDIVQWLEGAPVRVLS
jgi:phosphoglycerate dehydrogenase-like enzyme